MKKLLSIGCAVLLSGCAVTPGVVGMATVTGLGTAINIENSGNPVDSLSEAKDRVVSSVKEGYSRDHYVGHDLNE